MCSSYQSKNSFGAESRTFLNCFPPFVSRRVKGIGYDGERWKYFIFRYFKIPSEYERVRFLLF